MHPYEAARLDQENADYEAWAAEHADELAKEAHAKWVETLCEGHESLRGDAMGADEFCDGTCRPLAERDEDAWIAAYDADEPTCWD